MKMKNSSAGYSPFSAGASFSAYPAPYSPTSLVGSEDFAKSPFARSEGRDFVTLCRASHLALQKLFAVGKTSYRPLTFEHAAVLRQAR